MEDILAQKTSKGTLVLEIMTDSSDDSDDEEALEQLLKQKEEEEKAKLLAELSSSEEEEEDEEEQVSSVQAEQGSLEDDLPSEVSVTDSSDEDSDDSDDEALEQLLKQKEEEEKAKLLAEINEMSSSEEEEEEPEPEQKEPEPEHQCADCGSKENVEEVCDENDNPFFCCSKCLGGQTFETFMKIGLYFPRQKIHCNTYEELERIVEKTYQEYLKELDHTKQETPEMWDKVRVWQYIKEEQQMVKEFEDILEELKPDNKFEWFNCSSKGGGIYHSRVKEFLEGHRFYETAHFRDIVFGDQSNPGCRHAWTEYKKRNGMANGPYLNGGHRKHYAHTKYCEKKRKGFYKDLHINLMKTFPEIYEECDEYTEYKEDTDEYIDYIVCKNTGKVFETTLEDSNSQPIHWKDRWEKPSFIPREVGVLLDDGTLQKHSKTESSQEDDVPNHPQTIAKEPEEEQVLSDDLDEKWEKRIVEGVVYYINETDLIDADDGNHIGYLQDDGSVDFTEGGEALHNKNKRIKTEKMLSAGLEGHTSD
eukprot:SAG11_NODE_2034_length_3897_cov_168.660611_4_plen_533_part_00